MRFDWLSGHSETRKYVALDRSEEARLITAWQSQGDVTARDRIILAFLPLAMPIAGKAALRKGGPANRDQHMAEFMHEAVFGLMRAIDRFDDSKGYRFSTYARWWVMAAVNDHLVRNHSLVTFITSSDHKRLFFRLGQEIRAAEVELRQSGRYTRMGDVFRLVGERLDLPTDFVRHFAARMGGDHSLNATSGQDDSSEEFVDLLESERSDAEELTIEADCASRAEMLIHDALSSLSERERDIIRRRHLTGEDRRQTLAAVGRAYGITTERVRQIEKRALDKLQRILVKHRDEF
ncbi:sigma-70 family RNA polymerase sigma factor [Paracoccus sp. ME4]|uniref:sigma-70 family RNA polymerase sigma factor n=1 Tax=Paracoccus sp. ME4 TaxID=3138066 RepID=UPI00398B8040